MRKREPTWRRSWKAASSPPPLRVDHLKGLFPRSQEQRRNAQALLRRHERH